MSNMRSINIYSTIFIIFSVFLFTFLFISCNRSKGVILKDNNIDTLIKKSITLSDSSIIILKLADKKTEMIVQNTINKVNQLEEINNSLKNEMNTIKNKKVTTNTIIIRDTIYITEKKNFWGRKKVNIDSSGSSQTFTQDSTLNLK